MGSLSNNSRKLANFAGFYKGIQSAGGAVASGFDSALPPFMNEFAANFGLLAGGLVVAAWPVFTKVRDTVPVEDDLVFSDETLQEVKAVEGVAPVEIAEMAKEARQGSVGHA